MKFKIEKLELKIEKIENDLEKQNILLTKNIKILDWKLNLLLSTVLENRSGLLFSKEELQALNEIEKDILKREKKIKKMELDLKTTIKYSDKEKEWKTNIMHNCEAKTLHEDEGIMFCTLTQKECLYDKCPKV
ncbi:hypothetical protein GF327_07255 [Candidatus Woesearchaeota archaeon]|nr:hypothetical protein [Candidatus Woesearchaeota archaeon]